VLLFQRGAHGFQQSSVELAHELAHVLHLAALAFEVGDALGFGNGLHQLFGQAQASNRSERSVSSSLPRSCSSVAFAFEIGAAGIGSAFEFGLELDVQFAAFGNELASHKVAFFGFA
jgi:hypothetical protein